MRRIACYIPADSVQEGLNYKKALEKILDDNEFDVDDSIKCKQWIHTDGTKLIDMQLLVSEFIDMFLEKFDLLCRHHFIANAQSAFFSINQGNTS